MLIVIIASTEGVGHLKFELSVASSSWASGRLDRGQLRKAKLSPNKGVGEAGLSRENSSANLVETKQVITCERRKVACHPRLRRATCNWRNRVSKQERKRDALRATREVIRRPAHGADLRGDLLGQRGARLQREGKEAFHLDIRSCALRSARAEHSSQVRRVASWRGLCADLGAACSPPPTTLTSRSARTSRM